MQEENTVSQEEKVQNKVDDDGVIKVDLRNFNNKEDAVQSENNEETGMRVPDRDVRLSSDGDATADQPKSEESDEVRSSNEEEPLRDDGEPASEVRVLEEVVDEEKQPEETIVEKN